MTAGTYDIIIDQGSDFSLQLTLKDELGAPTDLSGYSARAQLRPKRDSNTLSATFTCSLNSPSTDGIISVSLSNAISKTITAGTYYYDIELFTSTSDSPPVDIFVRRILEGKARVTQEVTR